MVFPGRRIAAGAALLWLLTVPASAGRLPIVESGRCIGTVEYEVRPASSGAPSSSLDRRTDSRAGAHEGSAGAAQAADRIGPYARRVASSVLAARGALAEMGWPLTSQAIDFRVVITDLGPDRLGVADSSNRMRLAPPAADDEVDRLAAIVAHEYVHLCQYRAMGPAGASREERYLWWMEACALFLEYRMAPVDESTGRRVITYDDTLAGARGEHARLGLESRGAGSNLGYAYAPLAFILARTYGPRILSRSWLSIAAAARARKPISAAEAVVAELARADGGRPGRTFGGLLESYVRYLLSPKSLWLTAEAGLDVLVSTRLALEGRVSQAFDEESPALSFRVFALSSRPGRADGDLEVRIKGRPGLKVLVADRSGRVQAGPLDGTLEPGSLGEGARLVVVNPTGTAAGVTIELRRRSDESYSAATLGEDAGLPTSRQ